MQSIKVLARTATKVVTDNSPAILTGVAVAGVITTSVFAVRATPRALQLIGEAESEFVEPITGKQKVQLTWTCYIPAASIGLATIACIVGANTISTKRNAALVSVYSLTETAFKEYQAKVVETLGEKKEKVVRDEVAQDRVNNDPLGDRQVIVTGRGEVLCYDSLTGRYFNSDMETLRKAQNDINAQTINESYTSQNDFYNLIGLPTSRIGDEVGWTTDNMLDIDFSATLAEDGRPCISMNYMSSPIRGYYKFG